MNRIPLLLFLLPIALCISCAENVTPPDDVQPTLEPAFETDTMFIGADVDHAVKDSSFTIITRCVPTVTGKGRIYLHGGGSWDSSSWAVEYPLHDTLTRLEDDTTLLFVPVDFKAHEPAEVRWRVRLLYKGGYGFETGAVLDSVFIADSNRMYYVQDSMITQRTKWKRGYFGFTYSHFLNLNP